MRRKKTVMEKLSALKFRYDYSDGCPSDFVVDEKVVKRLLREVAKEAYNYGVSDGRLVETGVIKPINIPYARKGTLKLILGK